MSNAIFLNLEKATGEATDKDHEGWIDLQSISWGLNNISTIGKGGTSAGKATPSEVQVTKLIDSATPVLIKNCAEGSTFKEGIIEVMRAGADGKNVIALKITLNDVFLAGYSVSDGVGSGSIPMENLSLSFSKISLEYTKQKKEGGAGESVPVTYDLLTNEIT